MSKLALRDFEDELRALKNDYAEATQEGEEDWQKRLLAHQSMTAVITLMTRLSMPAGLDRGFTLLHEALWEIERGNKVSWLENATPGRPPVPERTVLLRARVAAVMEYLMKNKIHGRTDAAKFVVRGLPLAFAARLGVKSWRSVAEWRDGLTGNAGEERVAEVLGFNTTLGILDTLTGSAPERARTMLKAIAKA